MAAKEEVRITRLTVGAWFLMACRIPAVPLMVGSRRSFFVSMTLKWKGLAVDYCFEWWVADDGLGKSFWLGDVFYDSEVL
jgi:hypothetical protein